MKITCMCTKSICLKVFYDVGGRTCWVHVLYVYSKFQKTIETRRNKFRFQFRAHFLSPGSQKFNSQYSIHLYHSTITQTIDINEKTRLCRELHLEAENDFKFVRFSLHLYIVNVSEVRRFQNHSCFVSCISRYQ